MTEPCPRCGKAPADPGRKLCCGCREVCAASQHRRQLAAISAGYCRSCCKRRPRPGRANCDTCLEIKRRNWDDYYARNRERKLAYMRDYWKRVQALRRERKGVSS